MRSLSEEGGLRRGQEVADINIEIVAEERFKVNEKNREFGGVGRREMTKYRKQ